MDRLVNALSPPHGFGSGNADGLRASKLKHAVQGMNGDDDFCRTTPVRPRTQRISNHSLEPAYRRLHRHRCGLKPEPQGAD